MTSIHQLVQCSAVIMVLSCHSMTSLAVTLPLATVLQSDDHRVKEGKALRRDFDRFQKKQKAPSAPLASSPFSANMTRLTVAVTPKISTLPLPPTTMIHFGDEPLTSIEIKCRMKCIVDRVQDIPAIAFYIENETILPLSSGMPGVALFTAASDSRMQRPIEDKDDRRAVSTYRSDTHLTLNSDAYVFLRRGRNQFFCRAHSPSLGLHKSDWFVVYRLQ